MDASVRVYDMYARSCDRVRVCRRRSAGSGGGGVKNANGGAGGSGIVILRMPTLNYSGTTTGSPTVTTSGSDTILQFTGSGSYTG